MTEAMTELPTAAGPRQPSRAGRELWALCAIAQRDVIKLVRDRPRLAVNLAFPLLLVVGLGNVLRSTVGRVVGLDAVTLAFTGVLAATLFQSTAAGMISIAEDRETDFSGELFVAPISRLTLVGGKIAGESLVALVQGAVVVGLAALIGVRMSLPQLGGLLVVGVACCLLGGAFGLATLAAVPNQRSAMQIFQFLIIPQYVIAGVLVPLRGLPTYLDVLAWGMPLRYAVGLMRAAFYAGGPGYRQVVVGSLALDATVVGGLSAVLLAVGVAVFNHRERTR